MKIASVGYPNVGESLDSSCEGQAVVRRLGLRFRKAETDLAESRDAPSQESRWFLELVKDARLDDPPPWTVRIH